MSIARSRRVVRHARRSTGLRAIFIATLLVQLTFQTFTTWFALHGTERFGDRPRRSTIGFIAWAIGGVIGALPAGAHRRAPRPAERDAAGLRDDGASPAGARSGDTGQRRHAAARARVRVLDAAAW